MIENLEIFLNLTQEDKPIKEKRTIEYLDKYIPDISSLSNEQKFAYDKIISYCNRDNRVSREMYLLEGFAGSGKTFTISKVIEHLIVNGYNGIYLTAPTNKAVKVLENSSDIISKSINYLTIHKLLGLKEEIDAFGKQKFIQTKDIYNKSKINLVQILIIDEVSMLDNDLFSFVYKEVKDRGLKVIFLGDPAQIPPVNRLDSIPLLDNYRIKYNIKKLNLKEIKRQSLDNPINIVSFQIRNKLAFSNCYENLGNQINDKNEGIVFLKNDDENDKWFLRELCQNSFRSEYFKKDANFFKILAWTNKMVNGLNSKIRLMIFGDNISKLEKGEKIIADKPILDSLGINILFKSNYEMEVENYTISQDNLKIKGVNYTLNYYRTLVKFINEKGEEDKTFIKVIHEDSEKEFNKLLTILKNDAISKPRGSIEAKDKWVIYFAYINYYAQIKYNYAVSVHKSQGSTYENVVVIEHDINKNHKIIERNRIKYTSFTRASKRLFIVQ